MNARLPLTFLALTLGLAVGCRETTVQGAQGRALTLKKPADQTLRQGETEKVNVSISRSKFSDPVSVRFSDLPQGVKVIDADRRLATDESSATFNLQAAPDAALVTNHAVRVTVDGPDGLSATEIFQMTVKEKRS
jgi:hypothetical protein